MAETFVQTRVIEAIQEALIQEKGNSSEPSWNVPPITLDIPKREEWGDFSCNVPMLMAKDQNRSPLDIARGISEKLKENTEVFEKVEVAKPGFLNLTLSLSLWYSVLDTIEKESHTYGESALGCGQRVLIEYVSANPTGPLHMGHGRGAALGDAIARILRKTGYTVQREYYINDAGRQIQLLASSVFARYLELQGKAAAVPEDGYQGQYIKIVAEHIIEKVGTSLLELPPSEAEKRCGELAYQELLDEIQADLREFRVEFDSWFSEASLYSSGKIQQALDVLREKDLVYEEEGALWFRSSKFHDDKDRVVRKQNGEYTYLASDIAYHQEKLARGFDWLINIWGADHHGYVSRMKGAIQAFGYSPDQLRMVLVQMVSLLRGGEKIEMSKRSGEFVTLREVVREVGADAARFFFLMRRSDSHLEFDVELAKRQSADNPVFYVQYAHARLASLFRVARERGIDIPAGPDVDVTVLTQPEELRLIKHLAQFPSLVETCAKLLEPHRLPFYLQELAGHLHVFYYKHRVLPLGNTGEKSEASSTHDFEEPTLSPEAECSVAVMQGRLYLLWQVQTVIKNGLDLLGIQAPEHM